MSDKQKKPIQKSAKDASKSQEQQMNQNVKFRRGIEPEEMHRQGGNRVPDQGGGRK